MLEHNITQRLQTSLAKVKAVHYLHIARTPYLESEHGDSDRPKNVIGCSLYHCIAVMKISSKSALRLLSNG